MNKSGGVGFFGLLAVALIVLKLTGYIGWSWWWVLAPLWCPALVCVGAVMAFLALAWFWNDDDSQVRRDW